jgi:histidinol-phosphate aminotransferase
MSKINKFKPHLQDSPSYKGGKAVSEIGGGKVYKLSSNENAIGSSPKAVAAIRESLDHLNIYPDRTPERLQEALYNHYKHELPAEHFFASNSGAELIEIICSAFLEKGLECIVSSPCFMPYVMFSKWQNATVIDIPLIEPAFALDVEGILEAINDQTRLVFVCSPNNPTGTIVPKKSIDRLIAGLPDHVILVLDEVYFHFNRDPDFTTAIDYVKSGKQVIAINSLSKTYGLAALRIGFGYSTLEIANYLNKLYKPFHINHLSINGAVAALEDEEFVSQTISLVHEELDWIYHQLDQIRGVSYWKSQGNFYLVSTNIPKSELEQQMLEKGVMIRPAFGSFEGIRVTVGQREANKAFISALKEIMSTQD